MGTRIYVGNLSYDTGEDALRAFFEEGGCTVADVHIVMDRATGRPRGFAFVEVGDAGQVTTAIQTLDGRELDGRRLAISEARPRAPREEEPRGGGPPRGPRPPRGGRGVPARRDRPPPMSMGGDPFDGLPPPGEDGGRRRKKKRRPEPDWSDDDGGSRGGRPRGGKRRRRDDDFDW